MRNSASMLKVEQVREIKTIQNSTAAPAQNRQNLATFSRKNASFCQPLAS